MSNLSKIQSLLNVPKLKYNSFGKYKYRSCEDIIEAVKPIIHEMGYHLLISDDIVSQGDRHYIKAIATISDGKESYSCSAYAREEESKKGMDASQISGTASSYARKYALNGLLAINDIEDADSLDNSKMDLKNKSKPELLDLLESLYEYMIRRSDSEDTDSGGIVPNKEMSYTISIEAMMIKLNKVSLIEKTN